MRLWFLIWSFLFCLSWNQLVQAVSNGAYTLLGLTGSELEQLQRDFGFRRCFPDGWLGRWMRHGLMSHAILNHFTCRFWPKLAGKGNSPWHRQAWMAFSKLWHHFLPGWHWIMPKEWWMASVSRLSAQAATSYLQFAPPSVSQPL